MLEFFLAWGQNFGVVIGIVCGVIFFGAATLAIVGTCHIPTAMDLRIHTEKEIEADKDFSKKILRYAKLFTVLGCLLLPLAALPNMDEIWKIRVAVIKWELASPDNIKQAAETIERIGKKLECKYLGGCEKKGEEKKGEEKK